MGLPAPWTCPGCAIAERQLNRAPNTAHNVAAHLHNFVFIFSSWSWSLFRLLRPGVFGSHLKTTPAKRSTWRRRRSSLPLTAGNGVIQQPDVGRQPIRAGGRGEQSLREVLL